MDVLPAIVTQAVHTVDKIRVERVVDASTRRPPLQKKIGAGLDEQTFKGYVEARRIGTPGLIESLDFLAGHMGWKLSKRSQRIDPILAPRAMKTQISSIKKGGRVRPAPSRLGRDGSPQRHRARPQDLDQRRAPRRPHHHSGQPAALDLDRRRHPRRSRDGRGTRPEAFPSCCRQSQASCAGSSEITSSTRNEPENGAVGWTQSCSA